MACQAGHIAALSVVIIEILLQASRRSKITVTPINGTIFSTPLRGVSKFTKSFPAALFSTPLRGRKTQEIISNLLTFMSGAGKTKHENTGARSQEPE